MESTVYVHLHRILLIAWNILLINLHIHLLQIPKYKEKP